MVARSHSAAIVLASTIGLAAMAACSSGAVGPSQPGSAGPAPTSGGATSGSTAGNSEAPPPANTGGASATGSTTDGPTPDASATATASGPPPSGSCGGALPEAFTVLCSGCHTPSGTANSRYPDLYQFKGTLAAFSTQVRMGGGLMAGYSPALISDADIAAAFTYFTTNTRAGAKVVGL